MTNSPNSKSDTLLETSIPEAASLQSILCTEELQRRPSRPPEYEKENRALVKLVAALADSPATIFQTLAETILDITQCDSAGLSLLTRDGKTPDVCGERFYWPAIAGSWNPHQGGGTPRHFGPCGDVLDQNRTLLFRPIAPLPLLVAAHSRKLRMPAGSILRPRHTSRNDLGDHAQRPPPVRRRR